MKFDILHMDAGNRMIRLGVGQHNSVWFIRLDLWFIGFRLSRRVVDVWKK